MTLKIALIGSAPSSVALAPYTDPSWRIWACSPGARPHVKRVDAWFELHLFEPEKPWFSPEYVAFMAQLPCPVYMLEHVDAIPNSVAYPKQDILDRYGVGAVWFYTSSLSWMFAAAIAAGATEIGLWGVDMAAAEEIYTQQRAGCHYWIGKALEMGIKVTIPQQSDLMRPTPLYGFNERDGMHQKLLTREEELNQRMAVAAAQFENCRNEVLYLKGAVEDVKYTRQTFVYDRQVEDMINKAVGVVPLPAIDPRLQAVAEKAAQQQAQPAMRVGDVVDMGGGVSCTIEDVVEGADSPYGTVVAEHVFGPGEPMTFQVERAEVPTAEKIINGLGAMIAGEEPRTPVVGTPGTKRTVDEIKARVASRWESTAVPEFIEGA